MAFTIRKPSVLKELLDSGAAGGLLLVAAAILALFVANSDLADRYFGAIHTSVAGLDVHGGLPCVRQTKPTAVKIRCGRPFWNATAPVSATI